MSTTEASSKLGPNDLEPGVRGALVARLTAFADDELILAHRNSEWTGHAPILEEDIALANLAQDELGHATVWLGLRQALDGSDPDALAFGRDASAFRNAPMLELPRGDWAFTMLRQFLFDAFEVLHLERLRGSAYTPIAEAAAKIAREERFHLQHSRLWVERLGLGTPESHRRLQSALDKLWPGAQTLFVSLETDAALIARNIVPDASELRAPWAELVSNVLERAGLEIPTTETDPLTRERHTPHLEALILEMQSVAREDAEAQSW